MQWKSAFEDGKKGDHDNNPPRWTLVELNPKATKPILIAGIWSCLPSKSQARLITMAPDLLLACKYAHREMERAGFFGLAFDNLTQVIQQADSDET